MKDMKSHYRGLVVMSAIHLPVMYAVMFTMVYSLDEVFHNLNTFYMAGMMVAPMVLLMPLLMGGMYRDKNMNLIVYSSAVGLFLLLLYFMREQTFIDDKQFVRSMIPHHSGAILMCEKASLEDAEIRALCDEIIKGQKSEIDKMQQILKRL